MSSPILFLTIFIGTFSALSSSSSSVQEIKFIKTSCSTTSFPALCFSSLSKYANKVQQNPVQLAQIATKLSISTLKSAVTKTSTLYQESLSRNTTKSSAVCKALRDCKELLEGAMDNTRYSVSELNKIKNGGSVKEVRWKASNAQTYMSAVLTKEDTCIDGMVEMKVVVEEVSGRVGDAKMFTSIALGLVSRLC